MTERTVYQTQIGPVRARIVAAGGALALFDAKVRNNITRDGMLDGGRFWLQVFLPKRFSNYAYRFGYHVGKAWRQTKERQLGAAVPFVGGTPPGGGPVMPHWSQKNGEKMITAAINGASVRATATANRANLTFRIPYGHPVDAQASATFRTLPSWEVERIAQVTGQSIEDRILQGFASGAGFSGGSRVVAPAARAVGVGEPRKVGGHAQRRVA